MSDDDEAPEEAGSDDACSESSKCKIKCKKYTQSCSADSSEAGSSSNQDPSDSLSGSEECLARKVCLKRTRRKCSNSSGSSEEQSSMCSASSASESAKCHSESKDHVPEPASGSEDTESSIAKSSTAAAQSEESSQSNKTSNCDKNGPESTKIKYKSGWSLSEDSLLRSMKEADDGLSWEEIGKSLNRGKNECKGRWKVIKNHQPAQEETLPEDGFDGDDAKHQKAPSPTEADDEKTANDSNTPNQQVVEAASADAVFVSRQPRYDDDDDLISEHERQKRYWHRHIGRHLYPASSVRIEPDAHFSQSDCRVLEMIDARYGSLRWLEAQARFYNETGRMVPLEVIRRKCEDGAMVRTEADIDGWLESISD